MSTNRLAVASLGVSVIACAMAIGLLAERFSYTPTQMSYASALSERIVALEHARDPQTLDSMTARVDVLSSRIDGLSGESKDIRGLRLEIKQISLETSALQAGLAEIQEWMATQSPAIVSERAKELRRELLELIDKRDELLRSEEMVRQMYADAQRQYNQRTEGSRDLYEMASEAYEKAKQLVKEVEAQIIEVRLKLEDEK